jgi:hypothetical protein
MNELCKWFGLLCNPYLTCTYDLRMCMYMHIYSANSQQYSLSMYEYTAVLLDAVRLLHDLYIETLHV